MRIAAFPIASAQAARFARQARIRSASADAPKAAAASAAESATATACGRTGPAMDPGA